jgi:hypothetical protein
MHVRTAAVAAAITVSALALVGASAASGSARPAPGFHPRFHPQPAIHLSPGNRPLSSADGQPIAYTPNWGGYVAVPKHAGQTFKSISATWNAPTANCSRTPYMTNFPDSSAWVGLDGWNNNTVEQLGTDAACDTSGNTPDVYGWFEMYPLEPVVSSLTVNPGDAIKASVSYSAGVFTLKLTDVTSGLSQTERYRCPAGSTCDRSSAEVINEAPGSVPNPLSDFGMINFDSTAIVGPGFVLGNFTTTRWESSEIVQLGYSSNRTADAPSQDYGGRAFSMTWERES